MKPTERKAKNNLEKVSRRIFVFSPFFFLGERGGARKNNISRPFVVCPPATGVTELRGPKDLFPGVLFAVWFLPRSFCLSKGLLRGFCREFVQGPGPFGLSSTGTRNWLKGHRKDKVRDRTGA